MLKFYGKWLARAFHRSVDITDLWLSVVGVLSAFLAWVFQVEVIVTAPSWALGALVFGVILLGRLILSPYWLYREAVAGLRDTELERDALRARSSIRES
jgi:hypothetical protein